ARSRLKSRGIETGAVVTDGQPGNLRGPAQRRPSAIRLGVFGDVSQGLFGDAIQSGSGAPGEAGGDSAGGVIDRNAFFTGEFRAVFAHGHGQTKVVQRGRIQSAGEMVEVAAQAAYALLKGMRLPCGGRAGCAACRLMDASRWLRLPFS